MTSLREQLEATRDLLWDRLQSADDRSTAAIAARYQAVVTQLDSLPDPERESLTDELANGYKNRVTKA